MIHCPHCSRSIESHDGKPCPRKFSRRFFFGLMAGAGAAVAVPKQGWITFANGSKIAVGPTNLHGDYYLSVTNSSYYLGQLENVRPILQRQIERRTQVSTRIIRDTDGKMHVFQSSLAIPGTHRRIVGLEKL